MIPDIIEICGYKAYIGDAHITTGHARANIIFCDIVDVNTALHLAEALKTAFNANHVEISKVHDILGGGVAGYSVKALNVNLKEVEAWLRSETSKCT
jgi:hypothetical protein